MAILPAIPSPFIIPVMAEVVFKKIPDVAAAGICTGTVKVQVPSGGKLPPEKLMIEVPLRSDPVPQVLFIGKPVAVNPARTLVKLSVNSILLIAKSRLKFVIVNSRSTVVPGFTGSSRKLF